MYALRDSGTLWLDHGSLWPPTLASLGSTIQFLLRFGSIMDHFAPSGSSMAHFSAQIVRAFNDSGLLCFDEKLQRPDSAPFDCIMVHVGTQIVPTFRDRVPLCSIKSSNAQIVRTLSDNERLGSGLSDQF